MGRKILLSLFTVTLMGSMAPAFAAENTPTPPHKIYVQRTYKHQEDDRNSHHYIPNLGRPGEMAISDNDKIMLGKYVMHHYKNTCPWEHDYRFKRCVAPTPAQKKNFIIGYPLPSDVTTYDVPYKIVARLRPLPSGYKYVLVGNDVVLINGSSKEAVDAVTLLSAYGQ